MGGCLRIVLHPSYTETRDALGIAWSGLCLVAATGLEPVPTDFKSAASASCATRPRNIRNKECAKLVPMKESVPDHSGNQEGCSASKTVYRKGIVEDYHDNTAPHSSDSEIRTHTHPVRQQDCSSLLSYIRISVKNCHKYNTAFLLCQVPLSLGTVSTVTIISKVSNFVK